EEKGGAPLLAVFEKWPAEQTTPFDSAVRGRRSDLHLKHFPLIHSAGPASPRKQARKLLQRQSSGSPNRASGIGEDFVSGTRGVKGKAHCAISLPPTLRKVREGWATHRIGEASIKL